MPKTIDFTIEGGGDFGIVPVSETSVPRTARAESGRYHIEVYSSRLTSEFLARVKGGAEYVQDLGAFVLAQMFEDGSEYWMKASGGELTSDPFETGVLVGKGNADGSLAVERHDYLIHDSEDEFIEDDDGNLIEADR